MGDTMGSREETSEQKQKDFGAMIACVIGSGVWWFLSQQPSPLALLLAGVLLGYLFIGYCLLAILLPGPDAPKRAMAFVPIPQSEMVRPKALTL